MHRPTVIVTRKLPPATEQRLGELFDVRLNADDKPLSHDELKKAAAMCDVLVPTVTDVIDAAVLKAGGSRLKMIANYGAGVDHIDLAAAKAQKLLVTNTPGVLTDDTADIAMALILAAPRRLSEGAQMIRSNSWPGWSPTFLLGHRVHGKSLGILGMGRIGQAVARRAHGFGLKLFYHQRHRLHESVEQMLGATYCVDLDDMLQCVDVLSIHCPHTPQTHHLLNADRLKRMRRGAYLINTARGAIVDEDALTEALDTGHLAGAGLDVFEHEPQIHPGLRGHSRAVLLPHISSATVEARSEMGEKVIVNIKTFVDGHRPPDRVLL